MFAGLKFFLRQALRTDAALGIRLGRAAALAGDLGGDTLFQIIIAVAAGEYRAVAVAVVVDKAGSHLQSCSVNDLGGGFPDGRSDLGDLSVLYRQIGGKSRSAAAVYDETVFDKNIIHGKKLLPFIEI